MIQTSLFIVSRQNEFKS